MVFTWTVSSQSLCWRCVLWWHTTTDCRRLHNVYTHNHVIIVIIVMRCLLVRHDEAQTHWTRRSFNSSWLDTSSHHIRAVSSTDMSRLTVAAVGYQQYDGELLLSTTASFVLDLHGDGNCGMETNVQGSRGMGKCYRTRAGMEQNWLLWCTCSNINLFSNCWRMFALILLTQLYY